MKDEKSNAEKHRVARRQLLGCAALAGATGLLTAGSARAQEVPTGAVTPPTTPFLEPLPIHRPKEPVSNLYPLPSSLPVTGECKRAKHQRWGEFVPKKYYEMRVREDDHEFHPHLPKQPIWGFDGLYPGPTLYARYGEPIIVRIHNDLPPDHVGWGIPQISTHLHNLHNASESDGFPTDFINPGEFKDFHYKNCLAGSGL